MVAAEASTAAATMAAAEATIAALSQPQAAPPEASVPPTTMSAPTKASAPAPAAPVAQRKTLPATKVPARIVVPPAPARPEPRPAATPAAGAPGRLLVRSTPSGAEVFLNGERRGVSPVAVRDLPLGAYTVRVVRPGFEPSQQRVVLEPGRPARALEVVLARAGAPATAAAASASTATTGSLLIESRPSGAQALVDGVDVGRTPVTVPAAAVGARAVRIQLPGYLIISTTTRVEPGARVRVAVTLTAERPR